jgi:putative transposase
MIRPTHPTLSIVRQCRLASISRSSFYHVPQGESSETLTLMAEIDRQFLETPFYGARRQMTWHLRAEGHRVNVKRVRRLMRLMGLLPIYRRPRTSIPAKGHKVYPYLLRGAGIDRPNQVWCADITYIPLAKGFLYLVAVMDWWSPARFWRGVCRTPWTCSFVLMRWRRRSAGMVRRRSSTPIRAASLHHGRGHSG